MALPIRQGATHKVVIGPAVAVGDGFTPVTNLAISSSDEAEAILHDNGTVVDIAAYTFAAITTADGYYHLTLQSGISNTVGHLTIVINDDSLILPIKQDFVILDTLSYDAIYKDAAAMDVNIISTADIDFSATQIATINTQADLALTDYDGPTKAEMDTAHGLLATEAKQDIIDTNVDDIEALMRTLSDAFVLTSAVIETVTSQTQLVLPATADAVADDAYHGAIAVLIDADDANNKSFQVIEGYTASTRTVTLGRAPTFTVTTADTITILATTDAGGVWDMILTGAKHNIATSAGRRLRQLEEAFVHANGTIATVTNGHTFTLDAGAVATTDYYIGDRLQIEEGTGAGQTRIITAYTSGRVVTLDSDFTTNPDTSSLYAIVGADVHVSVSDADLAEGFVATYTNTTTITLDAGAVATTDYYNDMIIVFTHGTGAGQAREIKDYTSGRVVTMSPALITALDTTTVWHIMSTISADEISDEVWNEALSGHTTAGSTAKALADIETDATAILADTGTDGVVLANDAITAAKIATDAIGASEVASDFFDELWDSLSARSNTLQTAVGGTATLDASASTEDDFYNGSILWIYGGTGAIQFRIIKDYVGSTKVATIQPNWQVTPDNTSTFRILPFAFVAGFVSDSINSDALASSAVNEIVDQVWNETLSGHAGAGSTGKALSDIETDATAILVDTAEIGTGGAGLGDLGGMSTGMKAEVNAEALDVIATDTYAEPGQGAPGDTISIEEKISFIYAALINLVDVDSTLKEFYNAAGTVIWKKTVADDGSNYTEAKGATGP